MTGLRSLFLVATLLLSVTCFATDGTAPQRSLSDIRELERSVSAKRAQSLKHLEDGVSFQSVDPADAPQIRDRIEREFRDNMNVLNQEKDELVNQAQAAPKPRSSSSRGSAPNSALPRFQSQSTISYPQNTNSDAPAAEEKPQHEGSQKNVGLGTRELEF